MKILIIQPRIPHYRISLFEALAKYRSYEVDIMHKGECDSRQRAYTELTSAYVEVCGLTHFINAYKKISCYDLVIWTFDLHYIDIFMIPLLGRIGVKNILWGIGHGNNKGANLLKNVLIKIADATMLYSKYCIATSVYERYKHKIHVANNTIASEYQSDYSSCSKEYFLFIGTFNERKEINVLIEAYKVYVNSVGVARCLKLVLVGDGAVRQEILALVRDLKISDLVTYKGSIISQKKKADIYREAIACISPGQAGLSVLESFSFGVPFVTKNTAISGGEIYNVVNNVTGMFTNGTIEDLAMKMIYMHENKVALELLGRNAYLHYTRSRTIAHLVSDIERAIECVMQN